MPRKLPYGIEETDFLPFYEQPLTSTAVEQRIDILRKLEADLGPFWPIVVLVIWYDYSIEEAARYMDQRPPADRLQEWIFYRVLIASERLETAIKIHSTMRSWERYAQPEEEEETRQAGRFKRKLPRYKTPAPVWPPVGGKLT